MKWIWNPRSQFLVGCKLSLSIMSESLRIGSMQITRAWLDPGWLWNLDIVLLVFCGWITPTSLLVNFAGDAVRALPFLLRDNLPFATVCACHVARTRLSPFSCGSPTSTCSFFYFDSSWEKIRRNLTWVVWADLYAREDWDPACLSASLHRLWVETLHRS